MMAGSRMTIAMDAKEAVTDYDRPRSKAWETIGEPRLLVIGPYRMGFTLLPRNGASSLRVFIDYAPPSQGASLLVGRLFGNYYARWCTTRMARDAARHFTRLRAGCG